MRKATILYLLIRDRDFMYKFKDTKHDIPNTFAPNLRNKEFSVPELITNIGKGWIKRESIPKHILERIDKEIEFVRETQAKEITA